MTNLYVDIKEIGLPILDDLKIDISIIKKGCNILHIPFNGSVHSIIFIDRYRESLQGKLDNYHQNDKIFIYSKLNRNHDKYDYYHVLAITSANMMDDIKNITKIQKLKVFL